MLDTSVPVLALRMPLIGFSVSRRLRAASWRGGIGTGGGVGCRAALPALLEVQSGCGDGGRRPVRVSRQSVHA
jgi:hypothetical protein